MKILIINSSIALVLTLLSLLNNNTRKTCITLMLIIPLYCTFGWLGGYRGLDQPKEKMDQLVEYREAWVDGVMTMHNDTFKRYIPIIVPYLIALGILSLLPTKNNKSQEA